MAFRIPEVLRTAVLQSSDGAQYGRTRSVHLPLFRGIRRKDQSCFELSIEVSDGMAEAYIKAQ
jgi:hypothetical protein